MTATASRAWNDGLVGDPKPGRDIPGPGRACTVARCGQTPAHGARAPKGMVRVIGRAGEPSRLYCKGLVRHLCAGPRRRQEPAVTSPFDAYFAPTCPGPVYTVTLPAGMRLLNTNQRLNHWRRAEYTRALRGAATIAARQNPLLRKALIAAGSEPLLRRTHILGVLHPEDRSKRDPANWYPSFKAAVDGLVDAGVFEDDDSTRVDGPDMRLGPVVRGSQLVLHIRELPEVAQ